MVSSLPVVLLCVVAVSVQGHPAYRNLIPNGYTVPNACGSGSWEPVGHFDPMHHTQLKNQFGIDFASAGHVWTRALCQKDSDGDGRTNGDELGDPNCNWTPGTNPSGAATSHPGICEPIGSGVCSSNAFRCGCHGHQCV